MEDSKDIPSSPELMQEFLTSKQEDFHQELLALKILLKHADIEDMTAGFGEPDLEEPKKVFSDNLPAVEAGFQHNIKGPFKDTNPSAYPTFSDFFSTPEMNMCGYSADAITESISEIFPQLNPNTVFALHFDKNQDNHAKVEYHYLTELTFNDKKYYACATLEQFYEGLSQKGKISLLTEDQLAKIYNIEIFDPTRVYPTFVDKTASDITYNELQSRNGRLNVRNDWIPQKHKVYSHFVQEQYDNLVQSLAVD